MLLNKDVEYYCFFLTLGMACIMFGGWLILFNPVYDPLLSAVGAVLYIVIGGICVMQGLWGSMLMYDRWLQRIQ